MLTDIAQKAFSSAAGLSSTDLSLFIRTVLLAGFIIWAAWCVLELMKYYKTQPSSNIANLLKDYVQLFVLVSVVIA